MGELNYIYGTMGSAKTANALMQYFELKQQNKNVIIMKPDIADRDGSDIIKSRIGLETKATSFKYDDNLTGLYKIKNLDVLIIDECQFCSESQIDTLKKLSIDKSIKIYCYGLKNNYLGYLFPGSKRLIELADNIKSLEMSCYICGKSAEINALLDKNNNIIKYIDVDEYTKINGKYKAICYGCWLNNSKINIKN